MPAKKSLTYTFDKSEEDINRFMLLNEELEFSFVKVKFTKKDGSIREMICTKHLDDIPFENHPKGDKPLAYNENQIRVYERDNGWRSFAADSVISFELVD